MPRGQRRCGATYRGRKRQAAACSYTMLPDFLQLFSRVAQRTPCRHPHLQAAATEETPCTFVCPQSFDLFCSLLRQRGKSPTSTYHMHVDRCRFDFDSASYNFSSSYQNQN